MGSRRASATISRDSGIGLGRPAMDCSGHEVAWSIGPGDPPTGTPSAVGAPLSPPAVATARSGRRPTPPAASTPGPILRATPIPVGSDAGRVVAPNLMGLLEAKAKKIISQSDLMTTYV